MVLISSGEISAVHFTMALPWKHFSASVMTSRLALSMRMGSFARSGKADERKMKFFAVVDGVWALSGRINNSFSPDSFAAVSAASS